MADWSKPITGDTYADIISEIRARDEDVAKQFDGTTSSNIPTDAIRWNSTNKRWEKWNGTQWNPLSATYNIDLDFAPYGTISSTTVINAIKELADEKLDKSGGTITGTLQISSDIAEIRLDSGVSYYKRITCNDGSGNFCVKANYDGGSRYIVSNHGAAGLVLNTEYQKGVMELRVAPKGTAGQAATFKKLYIDSTGTCTWDGNTIWHAGNDGSGSGLDADKLDGYESSSFLRKAEAVPVRDSARNLTIKSAIISNPAKIEVTADEVILQDSSGNPYRATGVNVSIHSTASGVNGLDTGSMATNTWYYVWLIYNGSNVAGLISLSHTSPTLPSGYTHKALLGAVKTGATATAFLSSLQVDNRVAITTQSFTGLQGTSYISLNISNVVPPHITKKIKGYTTHSGNAYADHPIIATNTDYVDHVKTSRHYFEVIVEPSATPTIYVNPQAVASFGESSSIYITGYEI